MRDGAVTIAANLPGETFCFRQIEAFDQLLALRPAKLVDRDGDIRSAHAAGGFPATRAITVAKAHERRAHLVANRLAETTSSKRLFGHENLLNLAW
jgi:hypothetical protein